MTKKHENKKTVASWRIKVSLIVVGGPGGDEAEFATHFPDGHEFHCKGRHGRVALDQTLDAIRWWMEQQLRVPPAPDSDCAFPKENEAWTDA